jgi:hypothetical protein
MLPASTPELLDGLLGSASGSLTGSEFDSLLENQNEAGPFSTGDTAVYSLELESEGEIKAWTMSVTVESPVAMDGDEVQRFQIDMAVGEEVFEVSSRLFGGTVRLWDGTGALIGEVEVAVPHLMSRGMLELGAIMLQQDLEEVLSPGGEFSQEAGRRIADSMSTIIGLFTLVDENQLLSDVMWEVVEAPSLLSVIAQLGVEVAVMPDFQAARAEPKPDSASPWFGLSDALHFTLPITLFANGQVAAQADLLVTAARPPLAICGGIIGMTTRHPSNGTVLRMNLIGAHMAASGGPKSADTSAH